MRELKESYEDIALVKSIPELRGFWPNFLLWQKEGLFLEFLGGFGELYIPPKLFGLGGKSGGKSWGEF